MVRVDKEKCIGCGLCVQICGEVFEMDENNKAKVKEQKDTDCMKEAIDQCPVKAIS
jgi:ferredoxin